MREHGSFKMQVVGQTLIVQCFDSWNLETVQRMCKEYKALASTISDKPWACLVDMRHWELSTPEMWDEIDVLNEWGNANSQKYEAVVCSLNLQKELMVESHEVLTNVETQFCDTIEQAHAWLAQQGVYPQ